MKRRTDDERDCPACGGANPGERQTCPTCWRAVPPRLRMALHDAEALKTTTPTRYENALITLLQWCRDHRCSEAVRAAPMMRPSTALRGSNVLIR